MSGVITAVIMAVIFLLIGIFLFMGKGSWLIAGYNTATKAEKAKFDEKKLCRTTSFLCFVVFLLLCVMAYLGYRVETGVMAEEKMLIFAVVFAAAVLASLAVSRWYYNHKCRK